MEVLVYAVYFNLYIFSSCYTLTKPLVCFKEYSLLMMLLLCCMYVKNCMEDLLKLKFDQVRCKLRWKIILYFLYLHFIFLCFLKVVFLLGPKTQLIRFTHIFFFLMVWSCLEVSILKCWLCPYLVYKYLQINLYTYTCTC